jgi:hypothetical protein
LLLALPGFSGLRVPARLGTLVILCLASAAAGAYARVTGPHRARRWLPLVILAIVAECWPTFRTAPPPASADLLRELPADAVVVELPLGGTPEDVGAMYRAIRHGHATVNGYSGYDPPHYQILEIALAHDDIRALDGVAGQRPLFAALARGPQFDRWSGLLSRAGHAVVAGDGTWRVYRVDAERPTAPDAAPRLQPASISANLNAGEVGRLADGDLGTAWNAGQLQLGNEAITIDLGGERTVDRVRLEMGRYVHDFPRGLEVECSQDRSRWRRCWRDSAAALLIAGILEDGARAPIDVRIGGARVRALRLRQTSADRQNGWSIAELAVFGR